MSAIRPLVPGTLLVLGIALTGLGRAQVFMPVLFLGQVLTLLGSRQCGWRVLAGIGCPVLMISTSLVFLGSAYDLFGGLDRYLMAMAFATALNLGAWLIDQWAVGRLPGFAAPLVFPAVRIPIEVAAAFGGPLGLWGSFAAPAAGLWPISGLVAYGGFSLLSFVLLWLASSIAYFWHGLLVDQRPTSWRVLIPCLSVLTFCNIALSWGSPAVDHIRVAAIAAPQLSRAYSADD